MSTNQIQPQRRPRRGRAGGPAPKASGQASSPESLAPVHPSLLLESPTTVGGFFVPEDRFLWLRRAALLFRVLAALAIVGGAIVSVMVMLEERSKTPSEPLLRLFSILVGTGCAVIVQLAFAQAIDFFVRFGARADERAERATRRRIDLASRRA